MKVIAKFGSKENNKFVGILPIFELGKFSQPKENICEIVRNLESVDLIILECIFSFCCISR